MAVLFAEGFETYGFGQTHEYPDDEGAGFADDVYNHSWHAASTFLTDHADLEIISGRTTGTQALRMTRNATTGEQQESLNLPLSALSSATTWIVGIAFRASTWAQDDWSLMGFNDIDAFPDPLDPGTMLTLAVTSSGGLRLMRGDYATTGGYSGTLIDSGGTLSLDTWHYIELKVMFSTSVGSYEVRVDETTVMSGSGANTTATGNTRPYEFRIHAPPPPDFGETWDWDDWVVLDDQLGATGNEATDFIGDIHVMRVRPNDVGDSSGFDTSAAADNYTLVNEDQEDDDASYVESNTTSTKDLYHYENASGLTDEIFGVIARPVVRKTDGGDRSYRLLAKSDGTEGTSDPRYPSTDYVRQSYVWETDPSTNTQWTLTNFNTAQFGIEIVL